MNINLICQKKSYKFSLPLEVSLNYIKKLCSQIFKCKAFDIYYKGDKITKEGNGENEYDEKKILLKDIANGESYIKLKIVLNSTLSSTKNKTPSSTNSPVPTNKSNNSFEFGGNDNNINSNRTFLSKNQNNKIFETIYGQKTKKLFSTIKEFNRKIIAIDNFLFKKKPNFKNDNLLTFEKNLYNFIDGIKLYFKKLYTILETNNIVSYKEMIQNLNLFYNDLNFYDDIEQKIINQTGKQNQTITVNSTPKNKFPINLKKSENILSLNSDRSYFNKSSKKSSIANPLLLTNNHKIKHDLGIKTNFLNENKDIKKNDENEKKEIEAYFEKSKSKFVNINNNKGNLNENKIIEDKKNENDENNNNETNTNNNNSSKENDKKSEKEKEKEKILNLSSSKESSKSNLSEKSISSIIKKTDSNKDNSNEEEINNINNTTQNSNKSEKNENEQVVPFNLELVNHKESNTDTQLYKEIKLPTKNQIINHNKGNLNKQYLNSTIKENENENLSNSSYDNINTTNNNNKDNKEKKKKKKSKKKDQEEKNNITDNNKEKDNISQLVKELSPLNDINQSQQSPKNNSNIKEPNIDNNSRKNTIRKSLVNPIYHISSTSNDTEMAKVLSRKALMKKKKNKTSNQYDFLI